MEAEGDDNWGEGDDYEDPYFDRGVSETDIAKTKSYKIYSSDDIIKRQEKIINEAMDLLGISEDDAITALKHHSWNKEKLQEQWFDNEGKTREQCGLIPKKFLVSRNMDKQDVCYICYSKLDKDTSDSLS